MRLVQSQTSPAKAVPIIWYGAQVVVLPIIFLDAINNLINVEMYYTCREQSSEATVYKLLLRCASSTINSLHYPAPVLRDFLVGLA